MKKTVRKILGRLALSGIALFACLLMLELVFRLLPGFQEPQEMKLDRPRVFYGFEAEREHPWIHDPSNALHIVVIGDSFAAGVGCRIDDTFGMRLERLLDMNEDTLPVEVEIYARSGANTFQELDRLEKAFRRHADMVILSVCLNDAEDWSDPHALMRLRDDIFPKAAPKLIGGVIRRSRFLSALYRKIDTIRGRKAYVRYYEHIYDPEYPGWKQLCEAVGTFKKRCDEHDVDLVAVIFPLLSNDLHPERYPFRKMHEALKSVFAENRVPCLDLFPAYAGLSSDRLTVVPSIDEHPNEIAHRIAADEILEFLLDEEIIDHDYAPHRRSQQRAHTIWRRTWERMHDPAARDVRAVPPDKR